MNAKALDKRNVRRTKMVVGLRFPKTQLRSSDLLVHTLDISSSGASIGSLYQYFPNKDSVTIRLIEREWAALAAQARKALAIPEWIEALRAMIVVAVDHQLRRPNLARLLDLEEDRLASALSPFQSRLAVRDDIAEFLAKKPGGAPAHRSQAASDVIAIIGALTDAAGRRGDKDPALLRANVERAVLGYLGPSRQPTGFV